MPQLFPKATVQNRTEQRTRKASRIRATPAPLHLWHLASFDAPTVALVWAWSFAWAVGTRLPLHAAAVMVFGVWTVYVCDRLLDARAGLHSQFDHPLRERHYFHWRHRRILLPIALISAAITSVIVLACIPMVARERDSVLAAASLAYFARVHSSQLAATRRARPFLPPLVTKELLVGVLFAIGCALPALGAAWTAPGTTRWILIGCVAYFAALAWLNCHAIDLWESSFERQAHQPLLRIAFGLTTVGTVAALLLCVTHPRPALLLAACATSALFVALLHMFRARLVPVTLRAAADLVLLTPVLLIPLARLVR